MYPTTLTFDLVLPEEPVGIDLTHLYAQFQMLPDRRARRGVRYPLPRLWMVALLAKLAGQSHLRAIAEWAALRTADVAARFHFPRATLPHPVTWSRIFGTAVDIRALEQILGDSLQPSQQEVPARGSLAVALDGKTLRGTIPLGQTQGVHLGAAYLPQQGVVVAQLEVMAKENELVVAPTILAELDLEGVVVTGDALDTHRTLSPQSVEAGGDDVWAGTLRVKDNQPELHRDIDQLCTPELNELGTGAVPTDFTTARTLEKGHGRIEERVLTTSSMLQDDSAWPYLAQAFKLECTVTDARGTHTTVRYGITSLPDTVADAARLLTLVRGHWGIENGLHSRRDVTLDEDRSLVRMGHAPQTVAALTTTVLGLFARHGQRNVPTAQRTFSFHLERALVRVTGS